jgi:hypothetical protein
MRATAPLDFRTFLLEHLHKDFLKDANPLHVWQAYQYWRRWRRLPRALPALPDWVAAYFDGCATALLQGKPPHQALGLATRGGHSKFKQFADERRDMEIFSYLDFMNQLTRDDLLPEDARKLDWLFAPRRRGSKTKIDRICEHVAADMRRPDYARFSGINKPLSAKTLRDLYFRMKNR